MHIESLLTHALKLLLSLEDVTGVFGYPAAHPDTSGPATQVNLDGIEYQHGEAAHLQLDHQILRGERCLNLVKFLNSLVTRLHVILDNDGLGESELGIFDFIRKRRARGNSVNDLGEGVSGDWQGQNCREDCLQVL